MMTAVFKTVLANATKHDENTLNQVRDAIRARRDLDQQIADLDERRSELSAQRDDLDYNILPEIFDQAGVTTMTLQPEGNQPSYEATLKPDYYACIPQSGANAWPLHRQQAAFDWLIDNDQGDMVKTTITLSFGRGQKALAERVAADLAKTGVSYDQKLHVPWGTLTKFVRETIEDDPDSLPGDLLPLELIGARVGRVVKLKAKG
jgi:hypothetical protein